MGRTVPPEDRRGVIRDLVTGNYRHEAIAEARGVAPSTVTRYKQILEREFGDDLFTDLTTEPAEEGTTRDFVTGEVVERD